MGYRHGEIAIVGGPDRQLSFWSHWGTLTQGREANSPTSQVAQIERTWDVGAVFANGVHDADRNGPRMQKHRDFLPALMAAIDGRTLTL